MTNPSPNFNAVGYQSLAGPSSAPILDITWPVFGGSTASLDNGPAIQAAFTAAAANGGGTVLFPGGGIYTVAPASLPIVVSSNTRMSFPGGATISLPQTNDASTPAYNMFTSSGDLENFWCEGGTFRGNILFQTTAAANGNSLWCFYLRGGSLKNVRILKNKIYQFGDQKKVGGGGIALGPWSGSSKVMTDIFVLDNIIEDWVNGAIYIAAASSCVTAANDWHVRGNTCRLSATGIAGTFCQQNGIFVLGDTGIQVKSPMIANNIADINQYMDSFLEVDYADDIVITGLSGVMSQSTANVAATFTGSNPTIAGTNVFVAGGQITFSSISGAVSNIGAGSDGWIYYVLATGLTASTFQISLSAGGSAVVPNGNGTATANWTGMNAILIRGTVNGYSVSDVSMKNGVNGVGDYLLTVLQQVSGEIARDGVVSNISAVDFGYGIQYGAGTDTVSQSNVKLSGRALRLSQALTISHAANVTTKGDTVTHSRYYAVLAGGSGSAGSSTAPTTNPVLDSFVLNDVGDGSSALIVTPVTGQYVTGAVVKDPIVISPVGGTGYVWSAAFHASTGNTIITSSALLGGLTAVNPSYAAFVANAAVGVNSGAPATAVAGVVTA